MCWSWALRGGRFPGLGLFQDWLSAEININCSHSLKVLFLCGTISTHQMSKKYEAYCDNVIFTISSTPIGRSIKTRHESTKTAFVQGASGNKMDMMNSKNKKYVYQRCGNVCSDRKTDSNQFPLQRLVFCRKSPWNPATQFFIIVPQPRKVNSWRLRGIWPGNSHWYYVSLCQFKHRLIRPNNEQRNYRLIKCVFLEPPS